MSWFSRPGVDGINHRQLPYDTLLLMIYCMMRNQSRSMIQAHLAGELDGALLNGTLTTWWRYVREVLVSTGNGAKRDSGQIKKGSSLSYLVFS